MPGVFFCAGMESLPGRPEGIRLGGVGNDFDHDIALRQVMQVGGFRSAAIRHLPKLSPGREIQCVLVLDDLARIGAQSAQ